MLKVISNDAGTSVNSRPRNKRFNQKPSLWLAGSLFGRCRLRGKTVETVIRGVTEFCSRCVQRKGYQGRCPRLLEPGPRAASTSKGPLLSLTPDGAGASALHSAYA